MNQYPIRCRISNDGTSARVDVYDDIGGGLFGGGVSASDFATAIAGVRGSLDVHINSGGGVVWDGLTIASAIRNHKGRVTTVVDGLAASIASVIAQAGQERVMQPGSMLMIHEAFTPFEGNSEQMTKMAQTLDQVSGNLADQYAARCGGTAAEWRDRMRAETWFTADEAVAAGLADRVAGEGAAIPAGFDLAAYHMPSQIAASLRTLPVAAAQSGPVPGVEGQALAFLRAIVRDEIRAADGAGWTSRDGKRVFDPDGDGDDDSTAAGDSDHDYWDADGKQIKSIPPDPQTGSGGKPLAPSGRAADAFYAADKYSQDDRDRMSGAGQAMPDGSYPIADEEDLSNAIHAVGRGGADHDAIRRHIIKRAKALGASSQIPDNWGSDGSISTSAGDSLAAQFLALVAGATPARAGEE